MFITEICGRFRRPFLFVKSWACGAALRIASPWPDRPIAPHPRLIAVQHVWDRSAIMHIGGRSDHRVNNLGLAVDTDVRLHAEIPLIAFLRLMHLGVALPSPVLGRGRRGDDRRIHDGACANLQPVVRADTR